MGHCWDSAKEAWLALFLSIPKALVFETSLREHKLFPSGYGRRPLDLVRSDTLHLLLDRPLYSGLLIWQLGFYLISVLVTLLPPSNSVLKSLRLAAMFTCMNAALFIGLWREVLGSQNGTWTRTIRITSVQGTRR